MTSKTVIRGRYCEGLNLLPRHMHEGVTAYVEHGREVGGFLTALLEDDEWAWGRADATNLALKGEWEHFLAEHLPEECHGSPLKVAAWRKMGGLDGYPNAE